MIKINLLPARAAKKKENIRQQISIAVLSLVFALFAWGWYQVSITNKVSSKEEEISSIKKEMEAAKAETEELKKYKAKKDVFEKKFNIIKALREGKSGPIHILDDLSRSIPGFLWLTSFAQLEKEKAGEIQIKGKAFSNEAIAQFMENLEKSSYFSNVNLQVSQQTYQKKGGKISAGKNPELRDFIITCQFETPKEEKPKGEKPKGDSSKGASGGN